MANADDELNAIPFDLTDTDRANLAGGDENFQPHNWEDLKHIIGRISYLLEPLESLILSFNTEANDLSTLKRKPSDLVRYIRWTNQTKASYRSITGFVLEQRLLWSPLSPLNSDSSPEFACSSSTPFAAAADYKILLNDWPYGITPNITHLIVWSKIRLLDQKPEGYLTHSSTALVQDFVQRTFIDRLAAKGVKNTYDKILWFRNWTGLQSVRGLEHVHILVRDVPKDVLSEWINAQGS